MVKLFLLVIFAVILTLEKAAPTTKPEKAVVVDDNIVKESPGEATSDRSRKQMKGIMKTARENLATERTFLKEDNQNNDAKKLDLFINLLKSTDPGTINLCISAIYGLHSLCVGDKENSKDACGRINAEAAVPALQQLFRSIKDENTLKLIVDILFAIFEKVPQQDVDAFLRKILEQTTSDDAFDTQTYGFEKAREILAKTDPRDVFLENIDKFISAKFLPIFVKFLQDKSKSVQARKDAAFSLSKIAAGKPEHTNAVYKAEALKIFIKLLESTDKNKDGIDLKSSAIYGLYGLCVGDNENSKAACDSINTEAVSPLVKILNTTNDDENLLKQTVAILFAIFEMVPKPKFDFSWLDSPKIKKKEILGQTTSGTFDIQTYGFEKAREILAKTAPRGVFLENIDKFNSAKFLPILVKCLENTKNSKCSVEARKDAAFALANIASGSPKQRRDVYKAGALDIFNKMINSSDTTFFTNELCSLAIQFMFNLCVGDDQLSEDARAKVNTEAANQLVHIHDKTEDANIQKLTMDILFLLPMDDPRPNFDASSWFVTNKEQISGILKEASSDDSHIQANGIRKVREILARTRERAFFLENIDNFISANFLPIFVNCLKDRENCSVEARRDAALALSSITCGDPKKHKSAVYEAGALPVFIKLLESSDTEDKDLCNYFLLGLTNLCTGDDQYSKNAFARVDNATAFQRLVEMLSSIKEDSVLGNTVDILCRLIDNLPESSIDLFKLEKDKIQIMVENGAIKTFCALFPKLEEQKEFNQKVLAGMKLAFGRQESKNNRIIEEIKECHEEIKKEKKNNSTQHLRRIAKTLEEIIKGIW